MKKSVLIAVVGIAASVATSYGQGYLAFSSYAQTVTPYPAATILGSGTLLGSGYTAALYYALGTVSDPVTGQASSITADPTGFTLLAGVTAAFATSGSATPGFFDGGLAVIPDYTSGAITFEVVAYNGSTYDTSTIRGRTGSFTMTGGIRTDGVASTFGDNGTPMPTFVVTTVAVPEPATLALAGLGGLASLVMLRRKQS